MKTPTFGITLAALLSGSFAAARSDRPNILVILADDMGFSDLGCYGSEIHTPNLDKLASQGVRCTQFYNAARSCPSRAALLTGLYPHQAGMGHMVDSWMCDDQLPAYRPHLNDHCVTLGEVLKQGGYTTLLSGKWHVGEASPCLPTERGFDRFYGLVSGASNYYAVLPEFNTGRERIFLDGTTPVEEFPDDFYMTDALTDSALAMLQSVGKETPFFLYLAYTAPHWPLQAHEEDIARYEGMYDKGWEAVRKARYERIEALNLFDRLPELSPPDTLVREWQALTEAERTLAADRMEVYAAMVECMDRNIGRVIRYLEEARLLDNTFILFLSDNGACAETGELGFDRMKGEGKLGTKHSFQSYGRGWSNVCNTPFRGHKQYTREGGILAPAIIRYPPKVKRQNTVTDHPIHIIDVMTTCCTLGKVTYPEKFCGKKIIPTEGKDILLLIEDEEQANNRAPLAWEHQGNCAIREKNWKLVKDYKGQWELYDLENDRTELKDQARKYPEKVRDMSKKYEAWAARCGVVPFYYKK